MKRGKFLLRWARLLIFVGLLAACQGPAEPSPYEEAELNTLPGVAMVTKEETYSVRPEGVDVIITNNSEQEYFYGVQFSVERLEGEEWVVVPFEDDVAWIEIALILEPGGRNEEFLSFEILQEPLEEGTYRVVKAIEDNPLTAEFTIAP